jgi:hypothetical protein
MPSPLLSEPAILEALDKKVSKETLDDIRLGVMLATIDGRDRKVLREPFVDIVNSAFNLTNLLGRIYAYNYVKRMQEEGKLNDAFLDELSGQLVVHADAFRKKLHTLMKDVAACPYDEDSKH